MTLSAIHWTILGENGIHFFTLMVNGQVVRNSESGMRDCPVCMIDVFDPHACDSHIMRVSWQLSI